MQLNCKVIKKWQPPISTSTLPFQGYPPFLAKFLVPPQVTQFLEGPNLPYPPFEIPTMRCTRGPDKLHSVSVFIPRS